MDILHLSTIRKLVDLGYKGFLVLMIVIGAAAVLEIVRGEAMGLLVLALTLPLVLIDYLLWKMDKNGWA